MSSVYDISVEAGRMCLVDFHFLIIISLRKELAHAGSLRKGNSTDGHEYIRKRNKGSTRICSVAETEAGMLRARQAAQCSMCTLWATDRLQR